jgi:Ca-activated chloride channel homolog
MSFGLPLALAGLVVVPALLVGYAVVQRRRAKYALRFTNLDLIANLVDRAPGRRRHLPPLLLAAAVAALVVAVARPQVAVAVPQEEGTVILAMDSSGSMTATDVAPSRMAAARAAATTFVKGLPAGFSVGVVSFSDQADVVVPPTANRNEAVKALSQLRADNGTALGDAIARSVDLGLTAVKNRKVTSSSAPLVVLVLSDGASTTGDFTPLEAAAKAAKAKVPVYTVALGTAAGTIEVTGPTGDVRVYRVPPEPATLAAVAKRTGGQFFAAPNAKQLASVYSRIGSQVGTKLEKRELTSWFAAGGAALVIAAATLSALWFNRLP